MPEVAEPTWLDVGDAVTYASSSVSSLRRAVRRKELPATQRVPRGKLRFRRDDLDRWIAGLPPREREPSA